MRLYAFGLAVALIVLVGCGAPATRMPAPASLLPTPTLTPVAQPTPALEPTSIRGTLLDIEGNPVVGKGVVVCHEQERNVNHLEPIPRDLETGSGSWSATTDARGTFLLGRAAGQPDIPPSSAFPGNRYALLIGTPAGSDGWNAACSPYVLLGIVYVRETCAGDYAPQPAEMLWFTLEEGTAVDLGTVIYLEPEIAPCCSG
jgi:hypothetical protein